MKTQDEKHLDVLEAIVETVGSDMTRFEAAECASYLLRRQNGNLEAALWEARHPFLKDTETGKHYTY